jgi:dehydratase family protein
VLRGNLAPDGALIKVAGLKMLLFEGRARVFDAEEACCAAVQARPYQAGDVLIIRNEGPKGGPGMREMLDVTALIYGQCICEKVALVTESDRTADRRLRPHIANHHAARGAREAPVSGRQKKCSIGWLRSSWIYKTGQKLMP